MGAANGSGAGSVRFGIQPNSGTPREGSVQVASKTLTVQQAGGGGVAAPCECAVTPTSATVGAAGADVAVDVAVVSGTNCTRSSASNDAFIAVKSGGSSAGPGSAVLAVSANGGASRVGTTTIANQPVTILQESVAPPACAFSVSPTHANVVSAGGSVVVAITKTQGTACPWTAQSQAGFLSISSGNSGVDAGSVTIAVAPNGGTARNGTVVIAGQLVTVSQAAALVPCVLSVNPKQTQAFSSGGQSFIHVQKTQRDVCPWTAVSNDSFLVVTSGSAGVDTGIVAVQIQPNAGALRTGSLFVVRDGELWEQEVDTRALRLSGGPVRVRTGLSTIHAIGDHWRTPAGAPSARRCA